MWKSRKLRRIVKSALAAETLIQVEATEACIWLSNLLRETLHRKSNDDKNIKTECFTDNHQLSVTDYHPYTLLEQYKVVLQTEIALLKEIINKKEITKINWIENKYFIAECLTKYRTSS